VRNGSGHKQFITAIEIESLCGERFEIRRNYPEPFPRWLGRHFTHNKEVFELFRR
jgi:hypothetical protein